MRPPRPLLSVASLALAIGSCVASDSTTGVGRGTSTELAPSVALIPSPADSSALPINRIRVLVSRVSDGLLLEQVSRDVAPTDTAWTIDVTVREAYASETVYVFVRLISVSGGTEAVQFSGRAGPLDLMPGQTLTPDVPIVRGPVANLFTTGVTITSAPATLVVGSAVALAATVTSSGSTPPTVFWTSLDTSAIRMTGDTATAVGFGSADVVASAGAFSDTVSISTYGPLSATTTMLPDGTRNTPYSQALTATGGDGAYTWSLQSGGLPTGLALAGTGVISGTPTAVQSSPFTIQVASGDGQTAQVPLTLVINDSAAAGFNVVETGGSTAVDESGTTDTFTVVLAAQPATDVVFDLGTDDAGESAPTPTSLTFTNANWNVPQPVTVTGVDDSLVDGTQVSQISIVVNDAASDDAFDALADHVVDVTTTDDDVAGFTVAETAGATSVSESGTTDTLTVVLDAQPIASVVFDVSSANTSEVTVSPATLTFDDSTWDTPQTVVVTGVDDAVADGDQTTDITVAVDDAASQAEFGALADEVVSVTTVDDEPPPSGSTVRWANAVSGSWSTGSNWSSGAVPASGDSVVIDVPGSYTVQLDQSASIGSFWLGASSGVQTLQQSANTLAVADGVSIALRGIYELGGGSLAMTRGSLDGDLEWQGGSLTMTDTLTVGATGQVTLTAASTFGGGTIVNLGGFDWFGGNLTFQNGATLVNDGQMDITADALFQPFGGGTLVNNGTITQDNLGGSFLIDAVNDGTVDILAGTLNFSGQNPATHSGVFTGTASAYIGFAGSGAHQVDSTITGFARVNVAANTTFNGTVTASWMSVNQVNDAIINAPLVLSDSLTIQGDVVLNAGAGATSVPLLRMYNNQASVSGDSDLTVTDSLIWEAGSFQGAGARTLASTSGTRIVSTGNGSPTIDGVTLTNEGTIRFLSNTLYLQSGGSLDNAATGTFFVSHLGPDIFTNTSGSITNAGQLVKAGAAETLRIDVPVTNTGIIDVQVGTIELNAPFTHAAGATLQGSGTVDLTAAGPPLDLSGDVNPGTSPGVLNLVGALLLQPAASTYNIELGGTTPGTEHDVLAFSGDLDVQGVLAVDTLAPFAPSAGQQFPVLTVAGGSHTGSFSGVTYPLVAGVTFDTLWTGTTPDTLFIVASPLPGQTVDWTGGGDGVTWSQGSNWSSGLVPQPADTVVIDLSSATVIMDQDASVQSVTVGAPSGSQQLVTNGFNLAATGDVSTTGAGTVTVSTGDTITVGGAVINDGALILRDAQIVGPLDNGGSLGVEGTTSLTGALTTTGTSSILVRATSSSAALFTVPTGFTNNGILELTDLGANTVTLAVTSGTLVNAAGATLRSLAGINNQTRTITADLDNQGSFSVDLFTSLFLIGDVLSNSGAISLGGSLLVQTNGGTFTNQAGAGITATTGNMQVQFAGSDSFVNLGTIDMGSGTSFSVFGSGTMDLTSGTFTSAGQFSIFGFATVNGPANYTNTGQITVTQATWNGTSLTNAVGGDLFLRVGSTINANLIVQDTVIIDQGQTTTLSGSLVANAPIVSNGASPVTIDMVGSGTSLEGTLTEPSLSIQGTTSLSGSTDVTGTLAVSGTGSELDVNGQTLVVTGLLSTNAGGAFRMNNASDDVTVDGDAYFYTGVSGGITEGILRVSRHFAGDGFIATGSHITYLDGTTDQQEVTFGLGTLGQFADLDVTSNTTGIRLFTDVPVAGTFTAANQTLEASGMAARTLSMSGLSVDGATFDHVLIDYATTLPNGTLTLDNATFQNFDTFDVQISIKHPGGMGYALNGNTFSTVLVGVNVGSYLSLEDTASDGASINIDISSDPDGNAAAFTTVSGPDNPDVNWSP